MHRAPTPLAQAAAEPLMARRRAGIYVRISRDKREQAGVQRQEQESREKAADLGWDVVEVYVDNDVEASSGKPRPAYLRMLDDMRAGRINAVMGWHSDRIVRRPVELEELIDLADQHGVLFAAVKVGNLDLSNASGRLVARLLGATAKYETELKGERQSAQLKQRAKAGLPTGGGTRPFGWQPDGMREDPVEAAIVRQLAERAVAGESIGSLTEWLTVTGVPTVTGKPWRTPVVKRLLLSHRIAGIATYKGDPVGRAQWDALIDEVTHRRLQAVLTYDGPARNNRGRVALLPGLIWCGRCGFELVTFRALRDGPPPGVRSYGCRTKYLAGRPGYLKSCGRIMIKGEAIEQDVAERVLARLLVPANLEALAGARAHEASIDPAVDELREAEERQRQLAVDFADALLGRSEYLAARDRLAERIDRLRRHLGRPVLVVPTESPEGLAAWWADASLGKRQALVRIMVDRVEIGPHSGRRSDYDASRVTLIWR